ncbi:MAG TPA: hypothetical protein VFF49_12115 [Thermodesulfobacteriota bacterium]|nr:hypothetical protein [Thermodesulfobacteriota bacterium]
MATGLNGEMLLFDSTAVRLKGYEESMAKKKQEFDKMTSEQQDEYLKRLADKVSFHSNRAEETIKKALQRSEDKKVKHPVSK